MDLVGRDRPAEGNVAVERRKALALAAASSAILFSGLVAAAAVGGVKVLGLGEHRAQAGGVDTTDSVVVNQVRYVDDMYVVIPQTSVAKGPVKKKSSAPRTATTGAAPTSPTSPQTSATTEPPTSSSSMVTTTAPPTTLAPTTSTTRRPRSTTTTVPGGPTTTDN